MTSPIRIDPEKHVTAEQAMPFLKENKKVIKEVHPIFLDILKSHSMIPETVKTGDHWECPCGAKFLDKELV